MDLTTALEPDLVTGPEDLPAARATSGIFPLQTGRREHGCNGRMGRSYAAGAWGTVLACTSFFLVLTMATSKPTGGLRLGPTAPAAGFWPSVPASTLCCALWHLGLSLALSRCDGGGRDGGGAWRADRRSGRDSDGAAFPVAPAVPATPASTAAPRSEAPGPGPMPAASVLVLVLAVRFLGGLSVVARWPL